MPDLPHSPANPAVSIVPLDHRLCGVEPLSLDLSLSLVHQLAERLELTTATQALSSAVGLA